MDKNSITGLVLIALVFFGFYYFTQPTQEQLQAQKAYQDSIARVQQVYAEKATAEVQKLSAENFAFADSAVATDTLQVAQEEIVSLENDEMRIDFSTKGGRMVKAELKKHKRYDGTPLYLFREGDTHFGIMLRNTKGVQMFTSELMFSPILSADKRSLTMRYNVSASQYVDFVYSLQDNQSLLKFDVALVGMEQLLARDARELLEFTWEAKIPHQEQGQGVEDRYAQIHYKYVGGDVEHLSETEDENKTVEDVVKWVAFKDQFFTTTLIADQQISDVRLSSKVLSDTAFVKDYSSAFYAPLTLKGNELRSGFQFYLGAVDYSKLKVLDENVKNNEQRLDMDKLVPLGWALFRWVNQYFVIPLFNLLSSWSLSVGIIILLLTVIVKLVLAPFTYKAFMSSAKMRVLRPQVQEINQKYPNQDQMMERQRAVMDLYSRAGVSPLGGCLPMLLQMPVLIALFSFFPAAIELRQHSFLWANDLSTYDAIVSWDVHIPLVTNWFGNHISLFCLLMTIVNVIYMKFSMEQQDTGQQQMPGMKIMMYLMPVMMLVFLNKYPSGLTYYYFISTLITILMTIGFRYSVDEAAVLAQLEENKKKPRKKSGFMARLEEAQRLQQQQARERAKGEKGKRK